MKSQKQRESQFGKSERDQNLFTFSVPGKYLVDLYNAVTFAVLNGPSYVMHTGVDPESLFTLETMRMHLDRMIESTDFRGNSDKNELN